VPDDSITVWIRRLEAGDPEAAERLWKSYFPRMVRSARWRLQGFHSRLADEEDIALSAFKSFCRASGNLHQLRDRVSLWPSDLVHQMSDECQNLFDRLPDDSLRVVAGMKLEGYTNGEIAQHLGCGHRTVERKLQVIRQLWLDDEPEAGRAGGLDGCE
jgi:hypothetical protein